MFTNRISKMLVVLLVIVAALATVSFAARSATIPVADRSYDLIEHVRTASVHADRLYDSIEQMRADRSADSTISSYDQIEALRVQRGSSSLAVNSSYDAIEKLRLERGFNADRSYDNVEALRLGR